MDIKVVAAASIAGRDDERLTIDDEADVTEEAFVQDLVGEGAVVDGALRLASDTGARRGCIGLGHVRGSSRQAPRMNPV
jgi:hypothetical protein